MALPPFYTQNWAFDNTTTHLAADAESSLTRSKAMYMRNLAADPALCGLDGGIPELSVLDYMMFSRISYFREDSVVQPLLDEYFGKDKIVFLKGENQTTGGGRYLEFFIPGSNSVVIAARGTLTWYDLLNNVAMYSEVRPPRALRSERLLSKAPMSNEGYYLADGFLTMGTNSMVMHGKDCDDDQFTIVHAPPCPLLDDRSATFSS